MFHATRATASRTRAGARLLTCGWCATATTPCSSTPGSTRPSPSGGAGRACARRRRPSPGSASSRAPSRRCWSRTSTTTTSATWTRSPTRGWSCRSGSWRSGPGQPASGSSSASTSSRTKVARITSARRRGRVRTIAGRATVAPGVVAITVGGHSPGQQVVLVETAGSRVVLASDAVHFYEELERDRRSPWWSTWRRCTSPTTSSAAGQRAGHGGRAGPRPGRHDPLPGRRRARRPPRLTGKGDFVPLPEPPLFSWDVGGARPALRSGAGSGGLGIEQLTHRAEPVLTAAPVSL